MWNWKRVPRLCCNFKCFELAGIDGRNRDSFTTHQCFQSRNKPVRVAVHVAGFAGPTYTVIHGEVSGVAALSDRRECSKQGSCEFRCNFAVLVFILLSDVFSHCPL